MLALDAKGPEKHAVLGEKIVVNDVVALNTIGLPVIVLKILADVYVTVSTLKRVEFPVVTSGATFTTSVPLSVVAVMLGDSIGTLEPVRLAMMDVRHWC